MKSITNQLRSFHKRKPPIIETQWGTVTESARYRAALNMKADPALRGRVVELLSSQLGSPELGLAEARRRYPEAF